MDRAKPPEPNEEGARQAKSGERKNPVDPRADLGDGSITQSGGVAGGARGSAGESDSGAGGPLGESRGGPGEYKSTSRGNVENG